MYPFGIEGYRAAADQIVVAYRVDEQIIEREKAGYRKQYKERVVYDVENNVPGGIDLMMLFCFSQITRPLKLYSRRAPPLKRG